MRNVLNWNLNIVLEKNKLSIDNNDSFTRPQNTDTTDPMAFPFKA